MKATITELEKQVIDNIINSEFQDNIGSKMINYCVWSFSATNENKQLAGALGSLVKKGLCFAEKEKGEDEVCGLTKEGYEVAKKMGLTE